MNNQRPLSERIGVERVPERKPVPKPSNLTPTSPDPKSTSSVREGVEAVFQAHPAQADLPVQPNSQQPNPPLQPEIPKKEPLRDHGGPVFPSAFSKAFRKDGKEL